METEWATVPLPITAGLYPRSAVDGNVIRVVTFDQSLDDLPKLLVSLKGFLARGNAAYIASH